MCTSLDLVADVHKTCPVAVIHTHVKMLVLLEQLRLKDAEFKAQYLDLFPPDVPDICELPEDILMNIKLKEELKPMVADTYSCPRKYRDG